MDGNLIDIVEKSTTEELKIILDSNDFLDKDLQDFNTGKETIDNLLKINKTNVNKNVLDALIIYAIYKVKGGK